jgi:hypothetical protein
VLVFGASGWLLRWCWDAAELPQGRSPSRQRHVTSPAELTADPAGHASSGAWAVSGWPSWFRVAAQLARKSSASWEAEPGSAV